MSISATILDILDIKQHSSFKGKSIFSKGNKIIVLAVPKLMLILKKDIFLRLLQNISYFVKSKEK